MVVCTPGPVTRYTITDNFRSMPVFKLSKELVFPPPEMAHPTGLLAIGGDLSQDRLILAYSNGIFPWYSEGEPLMWWSPDPRMVLFPDEFKLSSGLRKKYMSDLFETSINTCFRKVLDYCSKVPRRNQQGTWITSAMKRAYTRLHKAGYAHSFETFYKGELVGGLYGVCIGNAFFGESMFYLMTDASKVAFVRFVDWCKENNIKVIDVQQNTTHLASLGAREIPRQEFLKLLV